MRRLGVYVRFGDRIDLAVNEQIQRLGRRVLDDLHPGVTDVQPSYTTLYVEYDARRAERAAIDDWLSGHLEQARAGGGDIGGNFVRVPVRYDGDDFAAVCEATGLARHELIDLHSGRDYHVFAVGASPGFPFLGVLDERLRMARHPTPRSLVPAHAVAMTGLQTGIYPVAGPGGWQLLGHALRAVYDPWRDQPFLIALGDTVRFEPEDGEIPPDPRARPLLPVQPELPALRVDETGLLDLVVDSGRDMGGRFGMAQSGPADARAARLANALVGNDPNEPLLELTVRGPSLTALRPVRIAIAGRPSCPGSTASRPRPTRRSSSPPAAASRSRTPARARARTWRWPAASRASASWAARARTCAGSSAARWQRATCSAARARSTPPRA